MLREDVKDELYRLLRLKRLLNDFELPELHNPAVQYVVEEHHEHVDLGYHRLDQVASMLLNKDLQETL